MDNGLELFLKKTGLSAWWSKQLNKSELQELPARLRTEFYKATRAVESDAPTLQSIENLVVDGAEGPLKARLYTPSSVNSGNQPTLVFFHGGGFVIGDLDGHEMICIRLAHAANMRVLAVDYRLAPEHKFPAAHNDVLAAYKWVLENGEKHKIDPNQLAVGGDSAGGNLSAFLAQECVRQDITPPKFQLLLYPLMQFADIKEQGLSFQEGFFISPVLFDFFKKSYLESDDDAMDVRISPLFEQSDVLSKLPPAHVIVCGWDPLNAEGKAYSDKLMAAGVPVSFARYPDMVHGFMNLTAISKPAREAIHDCGLELGKFFRTAQKQHAIALE